MLVRGPVKDMMVDVVDTTLRGHGFVHAQPMLWVRSPGPIRDLVEICEWKGATFSLAWGLSLDFAPHEAGGELRWHRTEKSARLNLAYSPQDHEADIPTGGVVTYIVNGVPQTKGLVTKPCYVDQRESSLLPEGREKVAAYARRALAWFEFPHDDAGLLAKFEAHRRLRWTDERPFDACANQQLAFACVLARKGRLAEAHALLGPRYDDPDSARLRTKVFALLDALARTHVAGDIPKM